MIAAQSVTTSAFAGAAMLSAMQAPTDTPTSVQII